MKTLEIDQNLVSEICVEGEKTHPFEGCGFVTGILDGENRIAKKVIPVENLQNKLHEKDPERYPRDAKTAYSIDPKTIENVKNDAEARGEKVLAIFHSHPEHGVYFSDEDKNMAAPWGEPLFPEMSYVVVSVYDAKAKACSEFYWDGEKKDFLEKTITLIKE